MKPLPTDREKYDDAVRKATDIIIRGGLIVYPTETFYGIGVRYDDEVALKRVYEVKGRPASKTLPLIIGSLSQLEMIIDSLSDLEEGIISKFWPGPLTMLLHAKKWLSDYIVSDGRVAVRMPGMSMGLDIARAAGVPITSTSANISSMPPALDDKSAAAIFGNAVDMIVKGGTAKGGQPSTIIALREGMIEIVRTGAIDREMFEGYTIFEA